MKCAARAGVRVSTARDGRRYTNAAIFSSTRLVVFFSSGSTTSSTFSTQRCRQTTRRASEVRRDRARASRRPATATTGAFSSIGDEAGEQMVARATDHRRRARSSRASSLTSSSQTENRDLNKRTAESEASPPSARPTTAPYHPSHGFCRPRGTSKPCRVGGVHYLSVH